MEPLGAEILRNERLMLRYADINQIATEETVAEIKIPGSGIGKYGDYPRYNPGNIALNQDNNRLQNENLPPKRDIVSNSTSSFPVYNGTPSSMEVTQTEQNRLLAQQTSINNLFARQLLEMSEQSKKTAQVLEDENRKLTAHYELHIDNLAAEKDALIKEKTDLCAHIEEDKK